MITPLVNVDNIWSSFQNLKKFHDSQKNRATKNDYLLYLYSENGYDYVGIESRKWAIWKRRIICVLSFGILSNWAFKDLNIEKIYGVAECLFKSKREEVDCIYLSTKECKDHSKASFMRSQILDITLEGKAVRHYRRKERALVSRLAILRKSTRDVIYSLERHLGEKEGTNTRFTYAIRDVADYIDVADAIKEHWVKLIHMIQFFVPREIRSWDTSFQISYRSYATAYDEAVIDGFNWMQKIYCDRSYKISSEKAAMKVYLMEIQREFTEFLEKVDTYTASRYKERVHFRQI